MINAVVRLVGRRIDGTTYITVNSLDHLLVETQLQNSQSPNFSADADAVLAALRKCIKDWSKDDIG